MRHDYCKSINLEVSRCNDGAQIVRATRLRHIDERSYGGTVWEWQGKIVVLMYGLHFNEMPYRARREGAMMALF